MNLPTVLAGVFVALATGDSALRRKQTVSMDLWSIAPANPWAAFTFGLRDPTAGTGASRTDHST
jgi:hypothetical protein